MTLDINPIKKNGTFCPCRSQRRDSSRLLEDDLGAEGGHGGHADKPERTEGSESFVLCFCFFCFVTGIV